MNKPCFAVKMEKYFYLELLCSLPTKACSVNAVSKTEEMRSLNSGKIFCMVEVCCLDASSSRAACTKNRRML